MSFFIDLALFGAAWYIGSFFASSITMIGCCLFCAFPLIRKIKHRTDCFNISAMKMMYQQSVVMHSTILAMAFYLVITLLPEPMQTGFFGSIIFTVLIGFKSWGRNVDNVDDFVKNIVNYIRPNMDSEAFLALQDALTTKPITPAEKDRKDKRVAKMILSAMAAFLLFVMALVFEGGANPTTDTQPQTLKAIETTVPQESFVEYKRPQTEKISTTMHEDCLAPFRLIAKSNADCYCVLKRTNGIPGTIKFFVRKGESIEFDVPLGTYRLYYATGNGKWYGRVHLFGYEGKYYEINGDFEFPSSSGEYAGWEADLNSADESNCYVIGYGDMP